jgi:hypothetical protein
MELALPNTKKYTVLLSFFIFLINVITINGCSPTLAFFDQYAYTQATSLKVDLQNLAQQSSTVSFTDAKADIDKVNTNLQKAYEYSRGRAKNTLSTDQYAILLSENGFYKSFLKLWQTQGKTSPAAADEFSKSLEKLMDQVIKLEAGKNKEK